MSLAVGIECYSLKSQYMLTMWTFPSFFFLCCPTLSHHLSYFSPVLISSVISFSPFLTLPFMLSHFFLFFAPAAHLIFLFLSPSVAVASQRSEDVLLTLCSSLFVSGLYFCTAVPCPTVTSSSPPHFSHAPTICHRLASEL